MNTLQSIATRGGSALADQVIADTGLEHEQVYGELVRLEASGAVTLDGRMWVMCPIMAEAVRRLA